MAPHGDKKGKGKEKEKPSSSSKTYPTAWSEWLWDNENKRYYIVREIAKGKPEYAFDTRRDTSSNVAASSSANTPRRDFENVSSSTSGDQYPEQVGYKTNTSTDPVSSVTRNLANTSIQPSIPITVPNEAVYVTTRKPEVKEEKFDKNYRQHHARYFKFGKVFKMLWSEPRGTGGGGTNIDTEYTVRQGRHGQEFYEKVRRFVVVDARHGHAICIPILTYGGRGTGKPGVRPDDHAIVYTSESPTPLLNEPRMTKEAIKVNMVYTIEYNVKVWFIGEVDPQSEWHLISSYNISHPPLQTRGIPPVSPTGVASIYNQASASALSGLSQPQVFPYTNLLTGAANPSSYFPAATGATPGYSALQPQPTQPSGLPGVITSSYGSVATSSYALPTSYQQPAYSPGESSTQYEEDSTQYENECK